ncbi:trypsin-like peptidase domain-containing protein [Candidatus Latescibacterota bacterium]
MVKRYPSQSNSTIVFILIVLVLFSSVPSFAALPLINNSESPFTLIYEKVSPAIVMIEVESEVPRRSTRGFNPWQEFFNFQNPQDEQRGTRPMEGMGSGVIFDRQGHIITNNHVIRNATKINVIIADEEEYKATVIGSDPLSDLAVIQIDLDGKLLPAERVAELGDSDTLKPGDYAIAIGNPVGLERTITVGVVSALGRHNIRIGDSNEMRFQDFIQTDAQINPGNSGGALVDINGLVVGINNMYTADYAAIGFAIPINLAKGVVNRIIQYGVVKRGFVGIMDEAGNTKITKDIQEAMGLQSTEGVLLARIVENSPAEKAGLENGDVIVSLDGEKIKDFNDFLLKIGEHSPGDTVRLGIIHDGNQQTVDLTLADLDEYSEVASTSGNASGHSWRGINVIDIDNQMAEQYGLDTIKSGVIVVHIDAESLASDADLLEGDVILEIENKMIKNTEDFERVTEELKDSDKRILFYRARKISNGSIVRRYITVKSE